MFTRDSAWIGVIGLVIVGCGGAAPESPATPVVAATSGDPLAPMEEGSLESPQSSAGKVRHDKVGECNTLIEVINKSVDELTRVGQGTSSSSPTDDYKIMANIMDHTADNMAKLDVRDERLRAFSADYQIMAHDVANAARAMIDASKSGNRIKMEAAKADVEKAVQREDPLVNAINKYCHEPQTRDAK